MSFNPNHTINLADYEEWFILYMDNELDGGAKRMVEDFLLLHPHLREELDLLLSTKLPAETVPFAGKKELQAESMSLNMMEEELLLYIDNELPPAGRKSVEAKIGGDENIQRQLSVLQRAMLDPADVIPYPDKKELYRHSETVFFIPAWTRVAVAIFLLLAGTVVFWPAKENPTAPIALTHKNSVPPAIQQNPVAQPASVDNHEPELVAQTGKAGIRVKNEPVQPAKRVAHESATPSQELLLIEPTVASLATPPPAAQAVEVARIGLAKPAVEELKLLHTINVNPVVTSAALYSYNEKETLDEGLPTDKTPAKGFLRKVSRFIERHTGVGTVNANNELLIGAVAFKLN